MKEELLIPLIGAVVVAVIAGAISLAVTILAKDQKTSEFRQLWIDSLRNDVSTLTGVMQMFLSLSEVARNKGTDHAYEFLVSSKDNYVEIVNVMTRIRLRLNVKEHFVLLDLIYEIDNLKGLPKDETQALIERVIIETQKILKNEWERVKRGERSYQILKWSSGLIFTGGVVSSILYFYPDLPAQAFLMLQAL